MASGGVKITGPVDMLRETVGVSDDAGNTGTKGPWKIRVPLPVNPQPIPEACSDAFAFAASGTSGGPLTPAAFQIKIAASHGTVNYFIATQDCPGSRSQRR
jgi:hypothetical protein